MAKIIKVEQKMPTIKAKKRVAAYARISMESERMHHSLSAQISYYNALIQKKPEWEFAGVYADDGISGTGIAKRTEFQRMLADCEAGKINIILTKSIQRFARNTVDLLETVRHLKDIGVEVRFQKKWKSTAKTDWWTEERKKEWGERHKNKFRNPNRAFYNEFTGFIKCGNCGENYRSQGKTYADGTKDRYWRCSESCGNTAIKHSTVQALVCDVLGIKKFSEEQMDAVIEKAVVSNGLVTFCFSLKK